MNEASIKHPGISLKGIKTYQGSAAIDLPEK